jgi:hypothetical protein
MNRINIGIFSIPIFLLLLTPYVYARSNDESLYNGDRGRDGTIFCDVQYQEEGTKSHCYDRNDTPDQYCDKYAQDDANKDMSWFCESVCNNYEDVIDKSAHCDNTVKDDNPTRFSNTDFQALTDCSNDGYRDGQNNPFDQERNEECEELNEKTGTNEGEESTYYLSFIDGCIEAGNTIEICETFTDA